MFIDFFPDIFLSQDKIHLQSQLDRALSLIEKQQKDLKESGARVSVLTVQVGDLKNVLENKVGVRSFSIQVVQYLVHFFLPSFLLSFLSSFLPFFFPSILPAYLPACLLSFLPSFLSSMQEPYFSISIHSIISGSSTGG